MRRTLFLLAAVPALLAPAASAQERRSFADPDGGPSWTAQLREGGQCSVLRKGRTVKGRYCGALNRRAVFQYTARREIGEEIDPQRWRTVFVVRFARVVRRATLTTLDGTVTYRRGRGPRVLLAVLRGDVEQGRLRVTVGRGSAARTILGGAVVPLSVPDPQRGDPWALDAGAGGACVRWERIRRFTPPGTELARGPERCGDGDEPLAVAAADRSDDRLVVTGVARRDVTSVVLRAQDGSRPVALDPDTGGFLAVLAGEVEPATLTAVATLRDGRQVSRPLTTG